MSPNPPSLGIQLFAKKLQALKAKFAANNHLLTLDEFQRAVPKMTRANAEKYYTPLLSTLRKYGITSKLRIAHFLAQVGHECISFSVMAEAGWLSREKRIDYYLKTYGSRPSIIPDKDAPMESWFFGRGAIQITHDFNYKSYSKVVGRNDILTNPGLIETDPILALDVAGWYWDSRSLNVYADQDNLLTITKKINGGTNGLSDREIRLEHAKKILGL
jgi:putative chitinase